MTIDRVPRQALPSVWMALERSIPMAGSINLAAASAAARLLHDIQHDWHQAKFTMTHDNAFPPEELDLWILAGQSNMEGVGELADALQPDPRVWSFTSAGQWRMASEPLHRFWESYTQSHLILMRNGLQVDRQHLSNDALAALAERERVYGAGLGLAFGSAVAGHTGRPVGLLPCAHGATSLEQWSSAHRNQGSASLYGAMLDRVKRCGRTPRGLIWYQGESEGYDVALAASYAERFDEWANAVRSDLGQPDLPILIVQIGCTTLDSPNIQAWGTVRAAQLDASRRLPYTAVTSAIDLPLVDCIHLNATGLQRLGRRLAKMAIGHAGPACVSVVQILEPPDRAVVRLTFSGVSGAWKPADRMAGFEVLDAAGKPHAINHVIHACRNRQNPQAIDVKINLPLQPGERLVYGYGLRPFCNVADEADMPLSACEMPLI